MSGLPPKRLFNRSAARLILSVTVISLVAASPSAGATADDLVIEGRGWGHGVGLAQDGALAMGRAGADVGRILDQFYPGTTDGSAGGMVRVVVSAGGARQVVVSFPGGGELRAAGPGPQPPGFPVAVPPATPVVLSVDGTRIVVGRQEIRPASTSGTAGPVKLLSYSAAADSGQAAEPAPTTRSTTTTTTAPPSRTVPPTTVKPTSPPPTVAPSPGTRPVPAPVAPPAGPSPAGGDQQLVAAGTVLAVPSAEGTTLLVDRQRRYRGALEIDTAGRVLNSLDVEDYLRGMGEVRDPSWPAAALQAQAVAARTYALHAMAAGGEICADDRCQVYLSADAEYPAMDEAVRATRSRVRRIGTELVTTFYSANAGGVSATPEEGFGPGGSHLPYLRAAPYPTDDPDPWTVRMSLADAGRKLSYPGGLSGARISRTGPSGRALEVTLEGDRGPLTLAGQKFAARLELRSTLFGLGGTAVAEGRPEDGAVAQGNPGGTGLRQPWAQPVGATKGGPGGLSIAGVLSVAVIAVIVGTAMVAFRRRRAPM